MDWKNPQDVKKYNRKYFLKNSDIQYRLSERLRSRLRNALNGNHKFGSVIRDLGCTIPELIIYLEKKFQSGMTWENWSYDGWHIDHIIPLNSFNLADPKQVKKACYYKNLQPMWAKDNLKKWKN